MAKAKPKAAAGKGRQAVLAAQMKAQPKKPNPFELKGTKGHFDTMGRRMSGKKQNVIKARQEAVNRRKKTLLVEYRQLRKANSFVDRRFGESDPELTEADKGLARLRAQRMKVEQTKKKRGSKFTLSEGADGGGEGGLTHMGRSLADDLRDFMDRPENDDLDQEMLGELVSQYHFGGGGGGEEGEQGGEEGEGGAAAARGPDGKPKTRKQVMEEIIAKSRMYRALKAQQREEDEAALAAMDVQFKELVRSAALARHIKPPGADKGVKVKADNPEDAAYDVAARELAFEAKGAAGERTLSPEELLERERQRLEKLEKERVKRMRGGADEEEDEDGEEDEDEEGEEEDGRRKRRREMRSGDALGDDYESEGDEDEEEGEEDEEEGEEGEGEEEGGKGMSELDKRRMKAAAGSHPLQESFRAVAAALAKKHGVQAPKNPYLEEEGEGDDEGEEEEGESGSEGEEEEESGSGEAEEAGSSDEEEGEEDERESDEELLGERRNPSHPPSTSRPDAAHANAKPAAAAKAAAAARDASAAAGKKAVPVLDGPLDLPYTIPLPSSYNEFAALVRGRPADQLHIAISRIRAFNAVALATDSKRKLQEFYGILVQHFAMIAGQSPLPAPSLDVLTRTLLELTPEVPYYAATVARARLTRMADQLTSAQAALGGATARSAVEAAGGAAAVAAAAAAGAAPTSPWPPARVVLQLKLFALLFPTSDRRHPVLTPAALLIGKYLNQCVVSNPHEAAVGLCLCSLMTHMTAPARRTAPEVLVFLRDCLAAFMPAAAATTWTGARKGKRKGDGADAENSTAAATTAATADSDGSFIRFPPGLLALEGTSASVDAPPLDLYEVLGSMSASDPRVGSDAFKLGLLRAALCGVRRAAGVYLPATSSSPSSVSPSNGGEGGGLVCFEQMVSPLRAVLAGLAKIDKRLPTELRELRSSVLKQLTDASVACVASRRPMVHPSMARSRSAAGAVPAAAGREYNPRFEDGFVSGRDYDPDRQRAEERRLKRSLVKERRGAMRELRRDAVFMAEERDRETAKVDTERMESERRFYSELQRQEADLRSGGQAGMNPHLKKKGRK